MLSRWELANMFNRVLSTNAHHLRHLPYFYRLVMEMLVKCNFEVVSTLGKNCKNRLTFGRFA